MALLKDEPKLPASKLLRIGIPSLIFAAIISFVTHQYAHIVADRLFCNHQAHAVSEFVGPELPGQESIDVHHASWQCPLAAFAGPTWSFLLAFVSFGWYMRNPKDLFAASMAIVNASARLPEAITVCTQLLLHQKALLVVDESSALGLLRFSDPTASVIITFFYTVTLIFLTITIIHDTKIVPYKWLVAVGIFFALGPIESIVWRLALPILL
jgi:hypothetical protein